ncbi:MAG TPA: hypothetical protein VFX96_00380 [Pyrinomonadaceae bacterium]|nr:hypothetical protein [Pyrinomonadaceae bacterium]
MFCPQCGTSGSEEMKFCKACGVNLYAVRQAVATRDAGEKFDWSKTWVAEMFLSGEEHLRRKAELERLQGVTPEVKRYNEIKAGVITACVGIGVMFFLFIIAEGIILSGQNPPRDAEIIRRIWAAGLIPLFVGFALIINGLFVSRKLVQLAERERREADALEPGAAGRALRAADTNEFNAPGFSVTEGTTKHLSNSSKR